MSDRRLERALLDNAVQRASRSIGGRDVDEQIAPQLVVQRDLHAFVKLRDRWDLHHAIANEQLRVRLRRLEDTAANHQLRLANRVALDDLDRERALALE